jgi:putative ATP-dependent endonuclease of the OLD family
MIIQSIHVKNFRSILDATLECNDLTVVVGQNGAGKSTFLRALEVFYSGSAKIEDGDFYNADTSEEIVIGVTFTDLSTAAKERFTQYLQGNTLTVEKVIRASEGRVTATYHGASLQHAPFDSVREAFEIKDRSATAKARYNELRTDTKYVSLAAWTNVQAARQALSDWEAANPGECSRERDEGRFFGFDAVGQGYLGRFTRFLFIPAVRDAADDALEGRGSALTALMDMVVRSTLAKRRELIEFNAETQRKYAEIVNPEKLQELSGLGADLSTTLHTYVPDASVKLIWLPTEPIRIDLPKADVRLIEDQYETAVHRTGHGLQRAFIMTLLQHLTKAQATPLEEEKSAVSVSAVAEGESGPAAPVTTTDVATPTAPEPPVVEVLPNLVLAIEEPELYQHPNRQRHFARILLQLSRGITPGVAKQTQVLYATHSPLFVDIERFDQVRMLRKDPNGPKKPKHTRVVSTTLDRVAELVWNADGANGTKFTGDTLAHRLHALMTPRVNEGFFARVVVLVEGEDDYAAIVGAASAQAVDLEALGVSVIPVGGKRSMDRPAIVFREFGIAVYLVWDADAGKGETAGVCGECKKPLDNGCNPEENRRLLRIVGATVEDWPCSTTPSYCCFKRDLETTLEDELGSTLFNELLSTCQKEFGITKRKHAIKNPKVIAGIIAKAKEQGKESPTLKSIVAHIIALANKPGDEIAPMAQVPIN